MRVQKLYDAPEGPGWVVIELDHDPEPIGESRVRIERPGHQDRYLSDEGWSASDDLLTVQIEPGNGFAKVRLGPSIVQHMNAGNNYNLTLIGKHANVEASTVLRWTGVRQYRPPSAPRHTIKLSPEPPQLPDPQPIGELAPIPQPSPPDPPPVIEDAGSITASTGSPDCAKAYSVPMRKGTGHGYDGDVSILR